jgi:NAD(P)-dependent dehydrogenase (short-subunit alcohol dehydrogenase family)
LIETEPSGDRIGKKPREPSPIPLQESRERLHGCLDKRADALLRGPEGEGIRSQSTLGRVATPEEVARTVAFLASEAPDFMTGASST